MIREVSEMGWIWGDCVFFLSFCPDFRWLHNKRIYIQEMFHNKVLLRWSLLHNVLCSTAIKIIRVEEWKHLLSLSWLLRQQLQNISPQSVTSTIQFTVKLRIFNIESNSKKSSNKAFSLLRTKRCWGLQKTHWGIVFFITKAFSLFILFSLDFLLQHKINRMRKMRKPIYGFLKHETKLFFEIKS